MRGILIAALIACAAGTAYGDEADAEDAAGPVQVHAFVSQGYLKTTDNNYLAETDGTGSFEFTEAGINVGSQITDRLRLGIQLFARDLGPIGDYSAKVDWAFFDYRWRDWLGVRAGRIKLPFGLYNDVSDIDQAHPAALLPQSIYPASSRDFLLAQTGVELYGYRDFDRFGALDYRAYAGTIFLEIEDQPGSPLQVLRFGIPYVVGARVLWEVPVQGLRLGASLQALKIEAEILSPASPIPVTYDIPAVLWVASADYAVENFVFVFEYSRWHLRAESSDPTVLPETKTVSERAYGMMTYRPRPWIQPGAYYSIYRPDVDNSTGPSSRQHDAALLLRFDVNPYWILKLEAHFMRGTASLTPALNGNMPLDDLANTWALFAAKATAYF